MMNEHLSIMLTQLQITSTSSETESTESDDSEYIPTPLRVLERSYPPKLVNDCHPIAIAACTVPACTVPAKCCVIDMRQLDFLIDQINRGCKATGCKGKFLPIKVDTRGMGGNANITYRCDQCGSSAYFQHATNTSGRNDISLALQVAFITAGCTHATYATYAKALQVMGIDAVDAPTFMSTIKKMHPIVEQMVEKLCEKEKMRMKAMDQKELGSWERAVTSADGTWMTRGYHSKNNYDIFNSKLFYGCSPLLRASLPKGQR